MLTRTLLSALVAACWFALPAAASTIVYCHFSPSSATSCGDIFEQATASVNGPFDLSVFAATSGQPPCCGGFEFAFASITEVVSFEFLGGTGFGFYTPCFEGFSTRFGQASASFGSLSAQVASGNLFTCNRADLRLPFVFGEVQTEEIHLFADAEVVFPPGSGGVAEVSFAGAFILTDGNGNPLPAGTWSVVVVPEPHEFPALGAALALGVAERARRRRRSKRTPPSWRPWTAPNPLAARS